MARRRTSSKSITVRVAAPKPARRHYRTRTVVVKKRRHSNGGGGGIISGGRAHSQIIAPAIAGFAVAKIESSGILDNIPSLPLLGKKGTACLAIHLLRPQASGILRDVKMFLAGLSGYELGKDGTISGYGVDGTY